MIETPAGSRYTEGLSITGFATRPVMPRIVPAGASRDWMNKTNERYAYLCLPLVIANTTGWDILSLDDFTARWDGGEENEAIQITSHEPLQMATSHFGTGVLTFGLSWVFRLPPGWNLLVRGIPNQPKDGVAPLEGVIEADWLPNKFTMNYIFTRPGVDVHFAKDEPICRLMPFPRGAVQAFDPVLKELDEDPDFRRQHGVWALYREFDRRGTNQNGLKARRKDYLEGRNPAGPPPRGHERQVRVKSFVDLRANGSKTAEEPDSTP